MPVETSLVVALSVAQERSVVRLVLVVKPVRLWAVNVL